MALVHSGNVLQFGGSMTASTKGPPPPPPNAELEKVISLITQPNSAELLDRHAAAVDRLCKKHASGFGVKDLGRAQQLLQLTLQVLHAGNMQMLEAACQLLRTMAVSLTSRLIINDIRNTEMATSVLRAVSEACHPGFPAQLHWCVTELLKMFADAHCPEDGDTAAPQPTTSGARLPVHQHAYVRLLHGSGMAAAVVRAASTAVEAGDAELTSAYLHCLIRLSSAVELCTQMVETDVLRLIARQLQAEFHDPIVPTCLHLLWNIVEHGQFTEGMEAPQEDFRGQQDPAEGEAEASSSSQPGQAQPGEEPGDTHQEQAWVGHEEGVEAEEGMQQQQQQQQQPAAAASLPAQQPPLTAQLAAAITQLFRETLHTGFKAHDKELRNDLLVVAGLLLGQSSECRQAFHDSGFTSLALAAATAPEMDSAQAQTMPAFALTTTEVDQQVKALAWLALTNGCRHTPCLQEVTSAGLLETLLQYADLANDSPHMRRWNPDQLTALRSAALLDLPRLAALNPGAYATAGGPHTVVALVQGCSNLVWVEAALRHIQQSCSQHSPAMQEEFATAGCLPVVLDQLSISSKPAGLRQAAAAALAALCWQHPENQRLLRKSNGIQVAIEVLQELCQLDKTLPSALEISSVDMVWRCIVANSKNLVKFLAEDGLDALLCLLEVAHRSQRPQLLSCLCDLMEDARAHPFLHEWRSPVSRGTAAHLLCDCWRHEDHMKGLTEGGVLASVERPLGDPGKQRETLATTVVYGNLAPERLAFLKAVATAVDSSGLLMRIYSVFAKLGFGNFGYLDEPDIAVLTMIEKYVKFKQGDVWRELHARFEREGMRPTAPDRERISSGIELVEHMALAVQDAQRRLLQRAHTEAATEQAAFLARAEAQRRMEAESKTYQKDRSQLTMRERLEAKQRREEMLKSSIQSFKYMEAH